MSQFKKMNLVTDRGSISIDNIPKQKDLIDVNLAIQISEDGRMWICINGLSFMRFKPAD